MYLAKIGFGLGLFSIIAWLIPLIGLPVTVCAIVFSSMALGKTDYQKKAVAGLVLGIVFVFLTLFNAILGAMLAIYQAGQPTPAPEAPVEQPK